MEFQLITPPAALPVSIDEARKHLNVEHDQDDTLILSHVAAATAILDGYDGRLYRCLMPQTWALHLAGGFPRRVIALPLGPVASIQSIEYVDASGATTTLAGDQYTFLPATGKANSRIVPGFGLSWPTARPQDRSVTITFVAGFAAGVPEEIKAAILLHVGHLYENRSAVNIGNITSELPLAYEDLLAKAMRTFVR